MAFRTGLEVRFVGLPKQADPDTILAREGSTSFRDHIHAAASAMEFAVTTLLAKGETSAHSRTQALLRIFEIVAECDLLVLREELISEAAKLLSLNIDSAQKDFQAYLWRSRRGLRREAEMNARARSEKIAPERLTTSEYELLLVVFHYRGIARQIAEVVENDWIDQSFIHGRLLNLILASVQEGLWDGPTDINHVLENPDEINAAYKEASENGMNGILEYTEEPLVSSDFIKNPHSCIIDGLSTMTLGDKMVKVVGWYDNEWGYSCRTADMAAFLVDKGL